MANEPALNMEFFNENINGSANINSEYKKAIEKEDHIITGECYLNYLFSNDYMKPFIRKNYEYKDDKKKSYLDKLNIFNYKEISNDILNVKKKSFATSENEPIKRILNILNTHYETKNYIDNNRLKFKNNGIKNTKYSLYMDTSKNNSIQNKSAFNNNKHNTSYEQCILPKIVLNNKDKINNDEKISNEKTLKNSFELTNGIFHTTSCMKTSDDIKKINTEKKERSAKKIHYYSPLLKKNILHYFKKVEDRENQSVRKSRIIKDGIWKINRTKFDIDSYDFEKNRYKINYKKNDKKKYFLITKFANLGKIKDPKEIEKTLFNKDENITFSKLKTKLEKKGIKRVRKNLELTDE